MSKAKQLIPADYAALLGEVKDIQGFSTQNFW